MAYLTRAGRYAAVAHHNAERHQLGTFDTERRAQLAEKLYKLWCRRRMVNVPIRPKTIDAW